MFLIRPNIRLRAVWTLAFLAALLAVLVGAIFFALKTSEELLDPELANRLKASAQIAALLVRPEQIDAIRLAETDSTNGSRFVDIEARMDAAEAEAFIRAEWQRLAGGEGIWNIILFDSDRRILIDMLDRHVQGSSVVATDPGGPANALMGVAAASGLERAEGRYLGAGYAPVFGPEGEVLAAVAVEGGAKTFRPLKRMRTTFVGLAGVAGLLVLLIGLGYIRTVSQFLRIEQNLRHTDLLASVGQLAAAVAHEIRNPLAVVRGASARLKRAETLSPAERTELLGMIDEEVTRLGAVVQNFLSLSRRSEGEHRMFELKPVLDRSLDLLRVELSRARIDVELDWQAPDDLLVEGDPVGMHHVFLNLALNSRDAMKEGGRFSVRVSGGQHEVRLQFADTGPGIPKQMRRHIFEPFYTTRAQGTGLGLAFVDRIVSEHGGSVTVKVAPGGGALFDIRLPAEVA